MKKKMFKLTSICLVIVMLFSLSSCFGINITKKMLEFDVGYFRIKVEDDGKKQDPANPHGWYYLVGLSELGKQQKVIIMPETINGHGYSYSYRKGFRPEEHAIFESPNLEKIYIEYDTNIGNAYQMEFKNCKQLKKIINNTPLRISFVGDCIMYKKFNYYDLKEDENGIKRPILKWSDEKIANIQYTINSPDENYNRMYWIDDVEDGEKPYIIPDEPINYGYTFGGWYCEKECINEWSFDTVIRKPALKVGEFYPDDYITFVYAKWIKD